MRRSVLAVPAAVLALAACQQQGSVKGPVVAKGNGITITADDFKARLDEQSPFIRARYTTIERKKEFLENLVRFEVLAREAEREGLARDPDVLNTMKKVMVQKLVQKNFQDMSGAKDMPDAELQKYYDDHKDEFQRPKKVRLAAVVFTAPEGSTDRAKKAALAKKALAKLKAEEKKNTLAFAQVVNQFSEDAASKATAGDLGFRSQDELSNAYGPAFADAAFALKPGESSGVVSGPKGLYILKATGLQEALNRPFDQVKTMIANKLYREKKTKEFEAWLKKLQDDAKVTIDDKALDAVKVSAPAPGMGGMMGPGMGAMPMAMPPPSSARPMATPVQSGPRPAPAPASAPAPAPAAH